MPHGRPCGFASPRTPSRERLPRVWRRPHGGRIHGGGRCTMAEVGVGQETSEETGSRSRMEEHRRRRGCGHGAFPLPRGPREQVHQRRVFRGAFQGTRRHREVLLDVRVVDRKRVSACVASPRRRAACGAGTAGGLDVGRRAAGVRREREGGRAVVDGPAHARGDGGAGGRVRVGHPRAGGGPEQDGHPPP